MALWERSQIRVWVLDLKHILFVRLNLIIYLCFVI